MRQPSSQLRTLAVAALGVILGVLVTALVSGYAAASDRSRPPAPSAAIPVAPELARERVLAAHRAQSRDAAWASRAERAFMPALQRASQPDTFEVTGMDCRTTSCLATLKAPSYDRARADVRVVLHLPYDMSCARDVFTPAPADPSAPYEMQVLFRCEPRSTAP
jgi:hypothetical protein